MQVVIKNCFNSACDNKKTPLNKTMQVVIKNCFNSACDNKKHLLISLRM